MSATQRTPVVLNDQNAYALQVGAARYGRGCLSALMHLYAYRGRVLVPAQSVDSDRDGIIDQTTAADTNSFGAARGVYFTVRSEVARPVWIVVSVGFNQLVDASSYGGITVESRLSLRVTCSDYDGTNNSTNETLTSQVAIATSDYPGGLAPLIKRPSQMYTTSVFPFRSTLSSNTAEARWAIQASMSGVVATGSPRVTSIMMVEEPPSNTAGA